MTRLRRLCALLATTVISMSISMNAQAQTPAPSIDLESMLDTLFFASGMLRADGYNLVFAPAQPLDARLSIVDAAGKTIGSHPFFPEYRFTDKAFARMQVNSPGEVQFSAPGNHELRIEVNGALAGVLPFTAQSAGSGDPFDTSTSWRFSGPWARWGYLMLREYKDQQVLDVVYWTGAADLAPGSKTGMLQASLLRNGKAVAHSRVTTGPIGNHHYKRDKLALFHPHERKNVNPLPFSQKDLMVDGDYELRIARQDDGAKLRSFRLRIAGGSIVQHARTAFGYTPEHAYIAPRVVQKNVNLYSFQEAIWMESK